ncbi:MAG: pyroglutamyl-peptidase I [Ramlibacter sp.]|jgi:pyroglutamyl-peptidase
MVAPLNTGMLSQPVALVTGFDAFGGDTLNPSWLIAQALHGRQLAGHRVVAGQLPTEFGRSLEVLAALLRQHQPALVVCLGQAGGRAALSLERVAINLQDARIADNTGARPIDTPVRADGPAAYFTRLPIKAMLAALQNAGIAAEVSQTAGTFVCNHVFYGLMHALATQPALAGVRGGFIHVPWLPQQGTPAMALDDLVRGTAQALQCALTTPVDLARSAGALH